MKKSSVILTYSLLACILFLTSSCEKDEVGNPLTENTTIWSGVKVTFEKTEFSDPTEAANQDRITSKVWITRGINGGQIYNASTEMIADKNNSPEGTLWALGTTADLNTLTFDKFRTTVDKPQQVVGKDLVLLLVEEDIAIDVKFTSWTQNQTGGGFTYERSSN